MSGYKLLNWQNEEGTALNAENLNALTDCVATAFIEKTATSEQIKNAIQAVHDAGGGSVVFPAGEWDDGFDLEDIQNVVIKGQGKYVTLIDDAIDLDENCKNIEIKNLQVDGYYGIENNGDNVRIGNCHLVGDGDIGLWNTGKNVKVENNKISGNDYGIYDTSDPADITDASYYIGNDVTEGISITGNAIVADTDSPIYANLDRDSLEE